MRWLLAAVFGTAVLAACEQAPVVRDAENIRFVSLNPCLDAILVEVAREDQILALSHYSRQPGGSLIDAKTVLRFGYTGGTAEEIIALRPDIVLASVFLAPSTKAALERAGLRVETFNSPNTVAHSISQIERMGELTGNSAAAASLAERIASDRPIGALAEAKENRPTVLLWQAGQIVAGPETLIAQLLREEGFASKSEALGLDQADYVTLEQVVSDPPDLLLVAGNSAGQSHPVLEELKGTHVHAFDPALFYCGGPSIVDARARLSTLHHSLIDSGQ